MAKPYGLVNEVQSTLSVAFVHGTDVKLTLTSVVGFPTGGEYIRVGKYGADHWVLYEYTGVSGSDLTGLTLCTLGVVETEAAWTFPIGTVVEVTNAAEMVKDVRDEAPQAHKDLHDPQDGSDKLDTAAAAEISVVVAAGVGTSHSFARADHIHAVAHSIANNHVLTVDGSPADDEFGRFTSDGLEGLTVAEAITALLGAALPENVTIQLDPTLSADTKWSGITEAGTAGTTALVYGYCYYLASTGKWELAKADVVGTSINKLGMCVGAAATDATGKLLLYGKIRADDEFPAFTVGAPVFLSAATAGVLTSTAPTGTTDFVVRIVGQADTADVVFFKPDNAYATLV